MEILPTTDPALIDRIAAGSAVAIPSAEQWIASPGVTVLAAMHEGEPVAGAIILESGELGLPEVHLQMAPGHGGEETVAAVGGFKAWLLEHRPDWCHVYTFALDERTERFARAVGFGYWATDEQGKKWFYYPLRPEAA